MKYHMQFSNNQNPISEIKTDRITLATPDINKASLILDAVKASTEDIYPWLPWAKRDITLKDIENYMNHFIECNKKENPSNLFFDISKLPYRKPIQQQPFNCYSWILYTQVFLKTWKTDILNISEEIDEK